MDARDNSHLSMRRATGIGICAVLAALAIIISSCGAKSGHFRVEGKFKHLNQGEFYIYTPYAATINIDTIKVADGRFVYDVPLDINTTFVIIFPNFSEQVVFGQPGATVKINGDASHLREMEITGTDDNKLMTDFRLNANKMTPPEVKESVVDFVKKNPKSPAGMYLVNRYFVTGQSPDYEKAYGLARIMQKADPANGALARQTKQLEWLRKCAAGGKLPDFKVKDIDGKTVSRAQSLNGKVNIINTWAAWDYDSQNSQRMLNRLKKQYGDDMAVLTVCVDGSKHDYIKRTERDSIPWPAVCDGKMWDTPLMKQMGLATVPGNIVADEKGTVVARNLDDKQLEDKIKSMLKN